MHLFLKKSYCSLTEKLSNRQNNNRALATSAQFFLAVPGFLYTFQNSFHKQRRFFIMATFFGSETVTGYQHCSQYLSGYAQPEAVLDHHTDTFKERGKRTPR